MTTNATSSIRKPARLTELVQQHATSLWPDSQVVFYGYADSPGLDHARFFVPLEEGERGYGSKFRMPFSWALDELVAEQVNQGLGDPYAGLLAISAGEGTLQPLSNEAAKQLMTEMSAAEAEADLMKEYLDILSRLPEDTVNLEADQYSGVFLPYPYPEYWTSELKVMLVGRETAGWNTDNHKNTLSRVINHNREGNTPSLVQEAVERYKRHLLDARGNLKTTSRSRFKQYYFKLAKELGINPKSIIYSNLFAWDYDKQSPLKRPQAELDIIKSISMELLAAQIKLLSPDVIIFAAGVTGIHQMIKDFFANHFDGHESLTVIPRKYWEFEAAGAHCFRIAHPRATRGHQAYRQQVIDQINRLKQAG